MSGKPLMGFQTICKLILFMNVNLIKIKIIHIK